MQSTRRHFPKKYSFTLNRKEIKMNNNSAIVFIMLTLVLIMGIYGMPMTDVHDDEFIVSTDFLAHSTFKVATGSGIISLMLMQQGF